MAQKKLVRFVDKRLILSRYSKLYIFHKTFSIFSNLLKLFEYGILDRVVVILIKLLKKELKKLLNSFRGTWTVPTEQELTPFLEIDFRGS